MYDVYEIRYMALSFFSCLFFFFFFFLVIEAWT